MNRIAATKIVTLAVLLAFLTIPPPASANNAEALIDEVLGESTCDEKSYNCCPLQRIGKIDVDRGDVMDCYQ